MIASFFRVGMDVWVWARMGVRVWVSVRMRVRVWMCVLYSSLSARQLLYTEEGNC
jgi:hypothetical protein